jgi:asparagine synthase (glutamine-hydrolysing)
MCGIAGGWFSADRSRLKNDMNQALEAMKFRGPNDHGAIFEELTVGTVALGHTRLSIIDLSSGGHQPMNSACGRYVIVFNGEIYNYLELKSELKTLGVVFTSSSDTEVLLAAWIQWGRDCLTKIVGMFAFVVFDRSDQTLTCVRDAFGIKPLFFSQESSRFVFGSELRALKTIKAEVCELN